MSAVGLIAILRGLTADEAPAVGRCLYGAGFRTLEVPLNSPNPLESIRRLRECLPDEALVGAGTVRAADEVRAVRDVGGDVIVSPHTDVDVIRATVTAGMSSYPGVATISEAFRALDAGAHVLKVFPADVIGLTGLAAWRAVLPAGTRLVPVGGVRADNLDAWLGAGAAGFGIGSNLYAPGRPLQEVTAAADELIASWRASGERSNPTHQEHG